MDKQYGVENIVSYRLVDHYSFISQPLFAPPLYLVSEKYTSPLPK